MDTLLYAGSFDPVTRGHLDIIRRAAALCGTLFVAVMVNPAKPGALPRETRVGFLRRACEGIPNVRIIRHDGLLADCAKACGAKAVVRGLRPLGDFETEYQMASVNRVVGGVETVMLITSQEDAAVSSSAVRELAAFGGDIAPFVPEGMAEEIAAALRRGNA